MAASQRFGRPTFGYFSDQDRPASRRGSNPLKVQEYIPQSIKVFRANPDRGLGNLYREDLLFGFHFRLTFQPHPNPLLLVLVFAIAFTLGCGG